MFYTNNLLLSINVVENLKYFTIYRRSSIFYIEIFESFYSVVNCTLSEVLSFFILLFLFLIFHSFSFLFNLPCNLAYTPLLSKRERERETFVKQSHQSSFMLSIFYVSNVISKFLKASLTPDDRLWFRPKYCLCTHLLFQSGPNYKLNTITVRYN